MVAVNIESIFLCMSQCNMYDYPVFMPSDFSQRIYHDLLDWLLRDSSKESPLEPESNWFSKTQGKWYWRFIFSIAISALYFFTIIAFYTRVDEST